MNYYISDMHWGQSDVLATDPRPFATADDCYYYMLQQWNQVVKPEDHVYIIGDCLSDQVDNIGDYLSPLNGHLHLVIGNHDHNLINHPDAAQYFEDMGQIVEIMDGDHIVVMCHFPMLCWSHKNHPECVHVFGHVHRNIPEQIRYINRDGTAYNAGCMINNYRPVTIRELAENNASLKNDG
jgi:calcineurin-like phosphoesterase family protein